MLVLQRIGASRTHPALHHRLVTGTATIGDDGIRLAAGTRLSFDAYFSSFFCSYWSAHTVVESLAVVVEGRGRFRIEVHHTDTDQPAREIARHDVHSEHATSTTLPVPAIDAPPNSGSGSTPSGALGTGRLWVELVAEAPSVVTSIAFATADQPSRDVVFSAGIVTHSRPEAVLPLVEQLRIAAADGELEQIVVVNQGAPLDPQLRSSLIGDGELVSVVEQANLGGSGGFARTMVESLAGGRASHHVLVEDDVVLDHHVLARSRAFLRFVRDDVVLGGQMLDLIRRTHLSHSGLRFHHDGRVEFLDYGLAVDDRPGLDRLTDVTPVDFNGWWFCVLPTALLAARGLPLPFFVENDDLELGLRLAADGVPTVMLAGLGVWHEPFWAKPMGWKAYYNLRNLALLAAVNPERAAAKSPAEYAWRVLRYVAQHDYRRAAWMLDALDDFVAGPEAFVADGIGGVHRRVVTAADRYRTDTITAHQLATLAPMVPRPPAPTVPRAALLLAGRLAAALIAPGRDVGRAVRVTSEWDRLPQNLDRHPWVLASHDAETHVVYRAERRAVLGLVARTAMVTGRLWARRRSAATRWRAFLGSAGTVEAWQTVFAAEESD